MNDLRDRRFVLGVTGGVAAYKSAELARLLTKAGASVDVVLTEAASQFVGAATFQALTGRAVWQPLWDARMANGMAHIDLTRNADGLLVAPATADFLAKLAHGLADDLLSTLCMARDCPLYVAPAMNRQMWENPATQRNVSLLVSDGIGVWGPAAGEQACGEVGDGRMLEPVELLQALAGSLQSKVLAGQKVVITAGPTFEALDPVRGISNSSSGKMGFALARAFADAGAEVVLVAGPVSLATPYGVSRVNVRSAMDMHAAVFAQLSGVPARKAIFVGVAAVADYRPKQHADQKIKKGGGNLTIELVPNPDILADVGAQADPPFCVGFAAESQNMEIYAEEKRLAKRLQLVVGNLIEDGLGGDTNRVVLFDAKGKHPLPPDDKLSLARAIVAHIGQLLNERHDFR